jgi:hypothetical protein
MSDGSKPNRQVLPFSGVPASPPIACCRVVTLARRTAVMAPTAMAAPICCWFVGLRGGGGFE